jgi:hypothetical protein
MEAAHAPVRTITIRAVCTAVREGRGAGSDHQPVIVTYAWTELRRDD